MFSLPRPSQNRCFPLASQLSQVMSKTFLCLSRLAHCNYSSRLHYVQLACLGGVFACNLSLPMDSLISLNHATALHANFTCCKPLSAPLGSVENKQTRQTSLTCIRLCPQGDKILGCFRSRHKNENVQISAQVTHYLSECQMKREYLGMTLPRLWQS